MAGVVKLTHYVLEWGTPEKVAEPMKMGRWRLLGTPPQEVGLGHKIEKRCSLPHFTPRTVLVVLVSAVLFQPFFVLFRPWRPLYMCFEFSLIVPCFRSFALPGSHSPSGCPRLVPSSVLQAGRPVLLGALPNFRCSVCPLSLFHLFVLAIFKEISGPCGPHGARPARGPGTSPHCHSQKTHQLFLTSQACSSPPAFERCQNHTSLGKRRRCFCLSRDNMHLCD